MPIVCTATPWLTVDSQFRRPTPISCHPNSTNTLGGTGPHSHGEDAAVRNQKWRPADATASSHPSSLCACGWTNLLGKRSCVHAITTMWLLLWPFFSGGGGGKTKPNQEKQGRQRILGFGLLHFAFCQNTWYLLWLLPYRKRAGGSPRFHVAFHKSQEGEKINEGAVDGERHTHFQERRRKKQIISMGMLCVFSGAMINTKSKKKVCHW